LGARAGLIRFGGTIRPVMTALDEPSVPHPSVHGGFLLCPCHPGAEEALTLRQVEVLPAYSRAAWRRGLVTFRAGPAAPAIPADVVPDLVFAHTVVRSLGQVSGSSLDELAGKAGTLVAGMRWDAVHVWKRDPRVETAIADVRRTLADACGVTVGTEVTARLGDRVLDCAIDAPDRWWVGWHDAVTASGTWPGGTYPGELPPTAVSRAWLKLDEAMSTFGLTFERGERALELGAAPGGACQRLLEAGLDVVGVDAAVVDATVAAHPRFEQWRMRAREVPLRRFRGFEWLLTDMNIDPTGTMAALGRLLESATRKPRGVIATLKLPEWSRAAELPDWLERFRSWGYEPRARQLSTGGREVCVCGLRPRGGVTAGHHAIRSRGPRGSRSG